MDPEKPVENKNPFSRTTRTVYRRRISLLRAGFVALVTSVALILFILWYRAYPQKIDCRRQAERIAVALEDYRLQHKSLPAMLDILPIKPGRYGLEHYEYYFSGLGGPETLPDDTLIAYCSPPHHALWEAPWRSVILFEKGKVTMKVLTENQFQTLRSRQRPPGKY